MNKRVKGVVEGVVQGVGFRPFIYKLACRSHLAGFVANTPQGVEFEVEGNEKDIKRLFEALLSEPPPLARISSVEQVEIPLRHKASFEIRVSKTGLERSALISPDAAICPDCLSEMQDPKDRRFRYPFINCTNCGPRYTITIDIPYDRSRTTMRKFQMCASCRKEYHDPGGRRFHAQPNACPECGPTTSLHGPDGEKIICRDPIKKAAYFLKNGHILAVKGLGGFHLAVDAVNHKAVVRLRRRKHREEKPLALMVNDLLAARELAYISEAEAKVLTSCQRPIMIIKKRRFHGLSSQAAPRNKYFGIMLPYTPLHYLLMEEGFKALVMTSGNMTEEPINIDNREAIKNLGHITDYFLLHNRDIHLRSDDSVLRAVDQVPRFIRRSRGYVPLPVFLSKDMVDLPPVLAVGGEFKNTICLTKRNRAFLSQHIGDMENLETLEFFHMTVSHLKRILEVEPQLVAHDLHPNYLATQYALKQDGLPRFGVQHHHAHIVSCLAEHGVKGPVIGLAMDGTGYGIDGQIWGGEILLSDLISFKRKAHLDYVPLPGGDVSVKSPWRMALVYLHKTYGKQFFDLPIPFVRGLNKKKAAIILEMVRKQVNSPFTSSCGRLFDAVSSLLGIRHEVVYEGQAAIELEMCQTRSVKGTYSWEIETLGDQWIMVSNGIIRGVVEDIRKGVQRGLISRRFHNTLIDMFKHACIKIRDETGIEQVVLSGGVFQNETLLHGLTRELISWKFTVFSHAAVPTNDGSLALGQAVCAGLRYGGLTGEYDE
jgi:hydrogenase maturation protein HypF